MNYVMNIIAIAATMFITVLAAELGDPKIDHTIFVGLQRIPLQQRIDHRYGQGDLHAIAAGQGR